MPFCLTMSGLSTTATSTRRPRVFTTSTGAIGDNIWFVTAMALLLTLITTIGAWREASA